MERGEKEIRKISVEELRRYNGLQNLTDEQAEQALIAIEKLAMLIYKMMKRDKGLLLIDKAEDKKRKCKSDMRR